MTFPGLDPLARTHVVATSALTPAHRGSRVADEYDGDDNQSPELRYLERFPGGKLQISAGDLDQIIRVNQAHTRTLPL